MEKQLVRKIVAFVMAGLCALQPLEISPVMADSAENDTDVSGWSYQLFEAPDDPTVFMPASITVTEADGSTKDVPVTWTTDAYHKDQPGTYTYQAEASDPSVTQELPKKNVIITKNSIFDFANEAPSLSVEQTNTLTADAIGAQLPSSVQAVYLKHIYDQKTIDQVASLFPAPDKTEYTEDKSEIEQDTYVRKAVRVKGADENYQYAIHYFTKVNLPVDITGWSSADFRNEAGTYTFTPAFDEAKQDLSSCKTAFQATVTVTAPAVKEEQDPEEKADQPSQPVVQKAPAKAQKETVKGNIEKIEAFTDGFVSGAKDDGNGNRVWTPVSSKDGHRFTFRVNYATSGNGSVEPGTIKIRIPASILRDRNKNEADSFEMSLPREDEIDADLENDVTSIFAYKIDGDDIVVYNYKPVTAAQSGYFEVSYLTTEPTFDYKDMGKSEPFQAHITAGSLTMEANPIPVRIDTKAEIESTYKSYPVLIKEWNSSWGEKPADADKYYYLPWNITSSIRSDTTQPFNFSLQDTIQSAYGTTVDGKKTSIKDLVEVIGYQVADKDKTYTDNQSQPNVRRDDDRHDSVLVRFPKSLMDTYTTIHIINHVQATVDPVDQIDPDTSAVANREFAWTKPVFQAPPGQFNIWKWGNENWNRRYGAGGSYHNSWDYASYSLDRFQEPGKSSSVDHLGSDNGTADLRFVVEAVGNPYPWTQSESQNANAKSGVTVDDPYDYGHKNVTYQITDDHLYLVNSDSNLFEMENLEDKSIYPDGLAEDDQELVGRGIRLKDGDYALDSLEFYVEYTDAQKDENGDPFFNEETQNFNISSKAPTDKNIVTVQVLPVGSSEYVTVGEFNQGTKKWSAEINTKYVDDQGGEISKPVHDESIRFEANMTFKPNTVKGYRLLTTNNYYKTYFFASPHYRLNRTDHVLSATGTDKKTMSCIMKNTDRLDVYQGDVDSDFKNHTDSTQIYSAGRVTGDRIRRTERNSSLRKHAVSSANDVKKKKYRIGWKVTEYETYTVDDGSVKPMHQSSGAFYDVIPLGATVDKDSVQVIANTNSNGYGGEVMPESAYTVEVVDNYRNSGRTMLVIRIKEDADNYAVTYETTHDWNSIKDYGRDILNPVAYETGNDDIADGYPDKPDSKSLSSETDRNLMTGLDETLDQKNTPEKFIYDDDPDWIAAITAAHSGLKKQVKAEEDPDYSYSTETVPDGSYSYRLRFANTYMSSAKDIILFDSLENYNAGINGNISEDKNFRSAWRGKLQSIDLSQLFNLGAAPVVYYSTVKELNLNSADGGNDANHDVTNTAVWTLLKDTSKLSDIPDITAIAIDISKKQGGGEFVLDKGKSVTAVLYMKAPHTVPNADGSDYPKAYNNVFVSDMPIDGQEHTEPFYIHQDYTSIRYTIKADFDLHKVSSESKDTDVKGISFALFGRSDYGNDINIVKTTDRNGMITFDQVEKGSYILQESSTVSDNPNWQEDHTKHTVVIDGNGNVQIDGNDYTGKTGDDAFTLTNTPRDYTNIEFTKRELVRDDSEKYQAGKFIKGAEFKLDGKSDYGTPGITPQYAVSDKLGRVTFRNLDKGTYTITETKPAEGYSKNNAKYEAVVNKDGSYTITKAEGNLPIETDASDNTTIYNIPNTPFKIFKSSSYDNSPVKGAKFNVSGTSNTGTKYNETRTSNGSGYVYFGGLEPGLPDAKGFYGFEPGSYILTETDTGTVTRNGKPIDSFVKDETKHVVTVDEFGKVTISGLKFDQYGFADWVNTENPSGYVTVIKKWDDGVNPQTHGKEDLPIIHISADKKNAPKKIPTISKTRWSNYVNAKEMLQNSTFKAFKQAPPGLALDDVKNKVGAIRIDDEKEPGSSIYVYPEGDTVYWWSDAGEAYLPEDSSSLFSSCRQNEIDLAYLDSSKVTNMANMFLGCGNLTNLNVSGLDTSHVTSMSSVLHDCYSLTELDLSGWDTSKVKNMSSAFQMCKALKHLDLTQWNTSSVQDMSFMFVNCHSLCGLDLSSFDTSNVTNMTNMFRECRSLTDLNVSNFDTAKVTNMANMFQNNGQLQSIFIGDQWSTDAVTKSDNMFLGCNNLPNFKSDVVDKTHANSGEGGYLKKVSTAVAYNEKSVLKKVGSLLNPIMKVNAEGNDTTWQNDWDYDKDTGNHLIKIKKYKGPDTTYQIPAKAVIEGEEYTTQLQPYQEGYNFSVNTGIIENLSFELGVKLPADSNRLFRKQKLKTVNFDNIDTSHVIDMQHMFDSCTDITYLDLSSFDTSKVTNMNNMFNDCSSLETIDVSSFDTSKVEDVQNMFTGCKKLVELDVSNFDLRGLNSNGMYRMLVTGGNLQKLVLGQNFRSWKGEVLSSIALADPYTGKWVKNSPYNHSTPRTSWDLIQNYDPSTMAGTWYAEIKGEEPDRHISADTQTYTTITNNFDPKNDKERDAYLDRKSEINKTNRGDYNSDEDAGYWKKIDNNTFSYTFAVYDPDVKWYVWEDGVPGYKSDYEIAGDPYKVLDKDQKNRSVTIVNTNTEKPKTGSLKLTKSVIPSNRSDIKDPHTFEFTITLSGNGIGGLQVFGDTAFNNGVARVTLGDGQSVTLTDIPEGTAYTVAEVENPNYVLSDLENASGTVKADQTVNVSAKNTKKDEENPTSFKVTKNVTGNGGSDGTFTFHASLKNLTVGREYRVTGDCDLSYTADENGNADVEFQLKGGQTAEFEKIPYGTVYQITEDAVESGTPSYQITDANNAGMIMKTNGVGSENHPLSTAAETADKGEDVTVVFTNDIRRTQDLHLHKVVWDEAGEKYVSAEDDGNTKYAVDVKFSGLEPEGSIQSSIGKITADEDGNASATVYIRSDETIDFYKIRVGAKYQFIEQKNDKIASYEITDAQETGQIIKASDYNNKAGKGLSTGVENVDAGEDATVTFKNTINWNSALIRVIKTNEKDMTVSTERVRVYLDENGSSRVEYGGMISDPQVAVYGQNLDALKLYDSRDNEIANRFEFRDGTAVLNGLDPGSYYVKASDVGDMIPFTIRTKEAVGDSSKWLSGAEFDLYDSNEDGSIRNKINEQKIITGNHSDTDKYGAGAYALIDNLSAGTYYLIETKTPEGMQLAEEPMKFEITDDMLQTINPMEDRKPIDIFFEDTPKFNLPITGQTGIILGISAGGIVFLLSLIGLMKKRKDGSSSDQ